MRLALCLLLSLTASAQSVTSVETYPPVAAIDVYNGLGTNITPNSTWEYQAAQAAHMTYGRFDASWVNTELQTCPANTSGGYALSTITSQGLASSVTYGVRPVFDALFGPPFCSIATGTLTSNINIGDTTVTMTVTGGSLSNIVNASSALSAAGGSAIADKAGYAGVIITGHSGSVITMAAAATRSFTAGTALTVNLLLYPPVTVTPGTSYTANASVQAYYNYANYLAQQIVAAGTTGLIELWNEPPWGAECWDSGADNCYDTPPPHVSIDPHLGIELPAYLSSKTPPAGVKWNSGYTDKAGDGSIFNPPYYSVLPAISTMINNFAGESMHPYGNTPEDNAWSPVCIHSTQDYVTIMQTCGLLGGNSGSDWKYSQAVKQFPYTAGGLPYNVTETGICTTCGNTVTDTQVARFNLRQFISWEAITVNPVIFWRLFDTGAFTWFVSQGNPKPVYTTFLNYMTDLGAIAHSPVAPYSTCMMPRVSSYTGYYPLSTASFVGSRIGDRANSISYSLVQRSYPASGPWVNLASPAAVPATVTIQPGLMVTAAKNYVAGTAVSFSPATGNVVVSAVADDPVVLTIVPTSSTATTPLSCT